MWPFGDLFRLSWHPLCGSSSAAERQLPKLDVVGPIPISRSKTCGTGLVAGPRPSKPKRRVRFPCPAPRSLTMEYLGIGMDILDTKVCSKCGKLQSIDEFSFVYPAKQDGKRRPDCKACVRGRTTKYLSNPENRRKHAERMAEIQRIAKRVAREYVGAYLVDHPCVDCGESDPIVLDFDHVKGEKVKDVSALVNRGHRLWRIKAEIRKCEVRCANCHRRVTIKRLRAKNGSALQAPGRGAVVAPPKGA